MNIGIVDDCVKDIQLLANKIMNYFEKNEIPYQIFRYMNTECLEENIMQFDILFLDVLLKETTGIYFAKKLREKGKEICIVFVSSSKEYMEESFEVQPFRYLSKPVDTEKLYQCLDAICKKIEKNYIEYKDFNKRNRKVCASDIMYIEMHGKISELHLKNGKVISSCRNLKTWIEYLPKHLFCKANRGTLINFSYIKKIEKENCLLKSEEVLYFSRLEKNVFRDAYFTYLDELL